MTDVSETFLRVNSEEQPIYAIKFSNRCLIEIGTISSQNNVSIIDVVNANTSAFLIKDKVLSEGLDQKSKRKKVG